MFKFRKARGDAILNDLGSFLREVSDEPIEFLTRTFDDWRTISYDELEDLILAGRLQDLIDWRERYAEFVNTKLNPLWLTAIQVAAYNSTRGKITIDDSDVRVKDFLHQRAGELITQLSDESKRAVANVILRGQAEHLAPKEIARQIRPLIGLNARQAQANVNYRQRVFNRLIDNGLSIDAANQRADRSAVKYASKQHRQRAETIVHTELARAYNQGAHDGILAAQRAGLMNHCEMVWSTAGTNRVCGRCLSLKDTVVGRTNEQGVQLPPLHPRCRCTIIYRETSLTSKPTGGNVPTGAPLFPRQQHFSTSDENIRATNPNYALGVAFQNNCQKCVPAYEMRMRGYDVEARPTFDIKTDAFAQDWSIVFENHVIESGFAGSGKSDVIRLMKSFGDGARGEVYVKWANDANAHVFVAENRNGEVYFLDPQTGETDVEYYFQFVKDGLTKLLRMDNHEPNEKLIKWFCKEVKHDNS